MSSLVNVYDFIREEVDSNREDVFYTANLLLFASRLLLREIKEMDKFYEHEKDIRHRE